MIVVAAGVMAPESVAASRQCVVVVGDGEVRGTAAASLLFGDYAVLDPDATLYIDSAEAMAGAVWRIGSEALRLLALRGWSFLPQRALDAGLVDAVTAEAPSLFEGRSARALDAASLLLSRRGGDALERAEFAWLFAIGQPQRGLKAFLGKREPRFE